MKFAAVADTQPFVYFVRSKRGMMRESQTLPIEPTVRCASVAMMAVGD